MSASSPTPEDDQAKAPSADIIDRYWDYILTEQKAPQSVYAFCKHIGVEETDFYQHASSFESIESAYWQSSVEETIAVLEADSDYSEYDSQQKLLAFYYTYFSHIQKHRSRFLECFPAMHQIMPSCLRGMRESFITWADALVDEGIVRQDIADRKKLNQLYSKALYEQLRFLIEYYRKDSSQQFQDTDALIEKSVRFFSDSARSGVIDSALDLARFMLRHFQPSR